jgi:hypothetical protein
VCVLALGHDAGTNLERLFSYHLDRPLEVESVLATPFWLAKLMGLTTIQVGLVAGSQVIVSPTADAVAKLSGGLLPLSLGAVLALVWRRRAAVASDAALQALAVLASLLACFVSTKVLSPQYFIWMIPAAALVAVDRVLLGALLAAVLALTHAVFPANYWLFARSQAAVPIAVIIVRNFVVVAAFALSLKHLWVVPAAAATEPPAVSRS